LATGARDIFRQKLLEEIKKSQLLQAEKNKLKRRISDLENITTEKDKKIRRLINENENKTKMNQFKDQYMTLYDPSINFQIPQKAKTTLTITPMQLVNDVIAANASPRWSKKDILTEAFGNIALLLVPKNEEVNQIHIKIFEVFNRYQSSYLVSVGIANKEITKARRIPKKVLIQMEGRYHIPFQTPLILEKMEDATVGNFSILAKIDPVKNKLSFREKVNI